MRCLDDSGRIHTNTILCALVRVPWSREWVDCLPYPSVTLSVLRAIVFPSAETVPCFSSHNPEPLSLSGLGLGVYLRSETCSFGQYHCRGRAINREMGNHPICRGRLVVGCNAVALKKGLFRGGACSVTTCTAFWLYRCLGRKRCRQPV